MKRRIEFMILGIGWLICIACAGKPQGFTFRLKADLINVDTGRVSLWTPGDEPELLLSAQMDAGKFLLAGTLPEPGEYVLKVGEHRVPIVLDAPEMEWYSDFLLLDIRYLKGSPATKSRLAVEDLLREKYQTKVTALTQAYDARTENGQRPDPELEKQTERKLQEYNLYRQQILLEYIRSHSAELYMPVLIREQMNGNYAWGKQAFDLLLPVLQTSQPGRLLKVHLDNIATTVEGNAFPAFTAENVRGEQLEFRVKQDTVYVIDFWASWCGPCRAEMQHLKKLYETYAGQPLQFVSVSLDKRGEDWRKADVEEALKWTSLWMKENFKAPLAKQLGIETIPFIVVVDKNGKIAGKNLRDTRLTDKINESLK